MKTFIDVMTEKDALTANGAVTNSTSHSANIDLFFLAGACRNESVDKIEKLLLKSYIENRLNTLKIIFWAGDIRQGAGERRFFKIALNWLQKNHPEDIQNNLKWIPEFSRWDVLFDLSMQNELVFSYLLSVLVDKENPAHGLLCKWLPRKVYATDKKVNNDVEVFNGKRVEIKDVVRTKRLLHNGIAKKIMQRLKLTPKQYRKLLVEGTKVVEQKMCAKQWNEIEYSKVPSVAINKYNKAWYRNDEERFKQYLEDVKSGKSKINASAIFPHDIIKNAIRQAYNESSVQLSDAQIVQWNALPNYMGDTVNSIIPVCDVSGSMTIGNYLPLNISVSLGLYISERNFGPFKDAFFTFSSTPRLCYLKGNIKERIEQLVTADWGQSTDLFSVFQIMLDKATKEKLSADLMPKTVLIISDMEFNSCADMTNFEAIKQQYAYYGYPLPQIVFWNVNGRSGNVPVTINNKGVALISGASPSIIKSVLTNNINPVKVMLDTINKERYSVIK